jgi:hypothetical protein
MIDACICTHTPQLSQTGGQPTNHAHENALLHQNTLPTLADVGICWPMQVTNTGHSRLAVHNIIIPTCINVRHNCALSCISCMQAPGHALTTGQFLASRAEFGQHRPTVKQLRQDACTCVHTLSEIAQSVARSRPTGHRGMHSHLHRAFREPAGTGRRHARALTAYNAPVDRQAGKCKHIQPLRAT